MASEFDRLAEESHVLARQFSHSNGGFRAAGYLDKLAIELSREGELARQAGVPETLFELKGINGKILDLDVKDPLDELLPLVYKTLRTDGYALDLLNRIVENEDESSLELGKVRLVRVNLEAMQLLGGSDVPQIYEAARKLTLEPLPLEAALAYAVDLESEPGVLAINPIPDAKGHPSIFVLMEGEDEMVLSADRAGRGDPWGQGTAMVFKMAR